MAPLKPMMACCRRWTPSPSTASPIAVAVLLLAAVYYASVSGLYYDAVNSPPAFGTVWDSAARRSSATAIMRSLGGQYLIEGLIGGAAFLMAAGGLLLLDVGGSGAGGGGGRALQGLAAILIVAGLGITTAFFRVKNPAYLVTWA